jgi:hypothetical protein
MSSTSKFEYLQNELSARIAGAQGRENYYRSRAVFVTLAGASLSAVTTVLISVSQTYRQEWVGTLALIVSALVSFLTAYEGFMRNRPLWVQANTTLMQFFELRSDISYRLAGSERELTEAELDKFYARYKEILDQTNRQWESIRKKPDSK